MQLNGVRTDSDRSKENRFRTPLTPPLEEEEADGERIEARRRVALQRILRRTGRRAGRGC
jgi:hypothetical protein